MERLVTVPSRAICRDAERDPSDAREHPLPTPHPGPLQPPLGPSQPSSPGTENFISPQLFLPNRITCRARFKQNKISCHGYPEQGCYI